MWYLKKMAKISGYGPLNLLNTKIKALSEYEFRRSGRYISFDVASISVK